jgi:hypothetical protein
MEPNIGLKKETFTEKMGQRLNTQMETKNGGLKDLDIE